MLTHAQQGHSHQWHTMGPLKLTYERLLAQANHRKAALTACMRKLISCSAHGPGQHRMSLSGGSDILTSHHSRLSAGEVAGASTRSG